MTIIQTNRLILRPWREEDIESFAKLNADPRVMEYFVSTRTEKETKESVTAMQEHFQKYGWGFWAATLAETGEFIGFIGLAHVNFNEHFTPAVEIGWRLAFEHWGRGYATEGAQACLQYAFKTLRLSEIVAFTPEQNSRSRRVMEKIGMRRDPAGGFDHPRTPEGHPLRRAVLYRVQP